MAKASKSEVEIVTKVKGITLDLSMDEVNALRAVFTKVGGCPDKSPRGRIEDIDKAIRDVLGLGQYNWDHFETEQKLMRSQPGIYFNDFGSVTE